MFPQNLPRGAIMADVAAYELSADDKQRLLDPNIGGVILFRRNFQNVAQLKKIVQRHQIVTQSRTHHRGGPRRRSRTAFY